MSDTWKARYTRHAIDFIKNNVTSRRVADKIFECRALLETAPDLGRVYDPEYPAARPPFPCRCLPISDTPFTLYYLKNEREKEIVVFSVDYQRGNPNTRFSFIDI